MPALMVSVSGVRGLVGDGLDPEIIVRYASAYADFCGKGQIVIGRDARITGEMVKALVTGTLTAKGNDVIDIGIVPTPTVQYAVKTSKAAGGIAITASHNPNEWNALKLLNSTGQFMSPEEHAIMKNSLNAPQKYALWNEIGKISFNTEALEKHKHDVLNLKYIDKKAIRKRKFRVLVDCVNGAGVYVIPDLLKEFGCDVIEINCEKTGIFPRLPEPLPENLTDTIKAVKDNKVDMGLVVDPDVDRLVLIDENGEPFGEENTIAQAVKFVLSKQKGNVAINLSTTKAVEDIAESFGCKTYRAPVGEAYVVKKMKEVEAVIGGEGSGGVIFPALHYGRDALVGAALTLQHMLEFGGTLSNLKKIIPQYYNSKKKIELKNKSGDEILNALKDMYKNENISTEDGLRIVFKNYWAHFRKSNTEPLIRIIVEARTIEEAERLCSKHYNDIKELNA